PFGMPHDPLEGETLGQHVVDVQVVVGGQGELLEVVGALHPPAGLARRLPGRQEQGDEQADDRDDDQQLDQGEAAGRARLAHVSVSTKGLGMNADYGAEMDRSPAKGHAGNDESDSRSCKSARGRSASKLGENRNAYSAWRT